MGEIAFPTALPLAAKASSGIIRKLNTSAPAPSMPLRKSLRCTFSIWIMTPPHS
jgi:hypothetical protein